MLLFFRTPILHDFASHLVKSYPDQNVCQFLCRQQRLRQGHARVQAVRRERPDHLQCSGKLGRFDKLGRLQTLLKNARQFEGNVLLKKSRPFFKELNKANSGSEIQVLLTYFFFIIQAAY